MTDIFAHGSTLRLTHLPPESRDFVSPGSDWYYLDESTSNELLTHDALTRFGQPISCSISDPGLVFISYGDESLCIREHVQNIRVHEHMIVLNETGTPFGQDISVGWDTASHQRFSALAEGFQTQQPTLDPPRIPITNDLDLYHRVMEAIATAGIGFVLTETEAANFLIESTSTLYITTEGLVLDPTGTPLPTTESVAPPLAPARPFTEEPAPIPDIIERNYRERIDQLQLIAEDEDISVSPESCRDFWNFIRNYRPSPQAGLILTDEDNLVAIWRETTGAAVEVEFLGNQQCKLIVFKDPKNPLRVLPEISRDTLASIGKQIGGLSFLPADQ